jgi:hypothetical protein
VGLSTTKRRIQKVYFHCNEKDYEAEVGEVFVSSLASRPPGLRGYLLNDERDAAVASLWNRYVQVPLDAAIRMVDRRKRR